mmetsp:Transcript_1828/g.4947  ORF Transcript_1828/g.4947 Transcript_1828/m.4947 type:complete len:585 (-) Transcript_1828:1130-2884(-)
MKVGNYILKETLGSGTFADVKLGIHATTGQRYAVKVFDRRRMSMDEFEREVRKEVKIMQYLRHPNIVAVEQVLMSGNNMYIVMELVEGGELYYEIVKRKRLDEKSARKYFQDLVDAMLYCHRKGVYHRDLKPENLLITADDNIKITDFGMSRMKESIDNADNLLHTQCGTPKYMAPEVIVKAKHGYKGDKIDTWDCGMVLFAMMAGYLPFNGDDDRAVFRQIVFGKVKFPKWFSDDLCHLLTGVLEKDPNKRMTLDEVVLHPWFLIDYNGENHPDKPKIEKVPSKVKFDQASKADTLGVAHRRDLKSGKYGGDGRSASASRSRSKSAARARSKSRAGASGNMRERSKSRSKRTTDSKLPKGVSPPRAVKEQLEAEAEAAAATAGTPAAEAAPTSALAQNFITAAATTTDSPAEEPPASPTKDEAKAPAETVSPRKPPAPGSSARPPQPGGRAKPPAVSTGAGVPTPLQAQLDPSVLDEKFSSTGNFRIKQSFKNVGALFSPKQPGSARGDGGKQSMMLSPRKDAKDENQSSSSALLPTRRLSNPVPPVAKKTAEDDSGEVVTGVQNMKVGSDGKMKKFFKNLVS